MSRSGSAPTSYYRVTCPDCIGYALEPRYSEEVAESEAEFHDDLAHGGEEHATVEEVDRDV